MDSLVLTRFRESRTDVMKALLTHRHFSGHAPDYDHIKRIDPELAFSLGDNGIVVWSSDAARFDGRPGIVFQAEGSAPGKVDASIRMNVADEATERETFRLDRFLAQIINAEGQIHAIRWLRGDPTRSDFGLPDAA